MVKIYCKKVNRDEFDRNISSKDHEDLDDLPRKSVGDQVKAFEIAGQNLEMSRRALFELENYDETKDVEEYDTGLDEYSDFHDYQEARRNLYEKASVLNASRKEIVTNKKETTIQETKVESKEKDPATAT